MLVICIRTQHVANELDETCLVHASHVRLIDGFWRLEAFDVQQQLTRHGWITVVLAKHRIGALHAVQEGIQKLVSFSVHECCSVVQIEAFVVFQELVLEVLQHVGVVFFILRVRITALLP